jgi:hypothetical protein
MKLSLIAALPLIGAASAASAQTYWTAAGISTDTVRPIA